MALARGAAQRIESFVDLALDTIGGLNGAVLSEITPVRKGSSPARGERM
jgi:hypothetical protein